MATVYIANVRTYDVIGVFSTPEAATSAVTTVLKSRLRDGQWLGLVNDLQWLIMPDSRPAGDNLVDGAVIDIELDSTRWVECYTR